LLQAVATGDASAFRQLYDLCAPQVYSLALSYTQEEQSAEEITQDVFTIIFKKAATFKGNAAVRTWIYRITVNTSLNFIKKKKRSSWLSLGVEKQKTADFVHPGVILENKEHAAMLYRLIETLPSQQKTAFILSFIEELPRQEVADIMETSLKAVESLLQRAKKKLRDQLLPHYPNRRKPKNKLSKK